MQKFKIGMNIRDVITAANMNEISDAVNWTKDQQNRMTAAEKRKPVLNPGEIFVKNTNNWSALINKPFCACVINGLVLPEGNSDDFPFETPVFSVTYRERINNSSDDVPWAVCIEPLQATGAIGKAVISGIVPAKVTIRSESHKYARPVNAANSAAIESCESSSAKILFKAGNSGEQWCILQLAAAASSGNQYSGPFALSYDTAQNKIRCESGVLDRNGNYVWTGRLSVTAPETDKLICIKSILQSSGEWPDPVLDFLDLPDTFSGTFPLGYAPLGKWDAENSSVRQYNCAPVIHLIAAGDLTV